LHAEAQGDYEQIHIVWRASVGVLSGALKNQRLVAINVGDDVAFFV
jgi:hypothetical protein